MSNFCALNCARSISSAEIADPTMPRPGGSAPADVARRAVTAGAAAAVGAAPAVGALARVAAWDASGAASASASPGASSGSRRCALSASRRGDARQRRRSAC